MTITIAEQPILVDIDGEAQCWLDRFMPEATIFRPPQVDLDQFLSGPDGNCNGSFFRSSLPKLPPVKIGQIQWPCVGVSRYARGLFLVDRVSLFEILHEAWGQAVPEEYPYAIPTDWTQTKNRPVSVFIAAGVLAEEEEGPAVDFAIWMYVLLPIRISDDLWILPLVDGRYFRLTDCKPNVEINPVKPEKSWKDLFDGVLNDVDYKISVDYADDAESTMGNPDTVFANPQVPTPFIVDAACFSIGRRPVVLYPVDAEVDFDFPEDSQLGIVAQKASDATTIRTATIANAKITGGVSGKSRRPRSINVTTRLSRQFFSGTNESYSYRKNLSDSPRNGIDLFCKAVWNTLDDQTAALRTTGNATKVSFEAYVDEIAGKLNAWNLDEYYIAFPDLVRIEPSGFDDYIVYEASGGKKTTTVRSLPIDFVAPFLLAQASSADDDTGNQTKWFRTANQTVVGRISDGMPVGGVTGGFRDDIKEFVLIHHPSLVVGGILNRAEVHAVATEKYRELAAGTIVHLAWVDDYYSGIGAEGYYSNWVIDWADCDDG